MKNFCRKTGSLLLALCLLAAAALPAHAAKISSKAYDILSDIMYTYKKNGPSSYLEIQQMVADLKEVDPALATFCRTGCPRMTVSASWCWAISSIRTEAWPRS